MLTEREFKRTVDNGQIPGLRDFDYINVILRLCDDLKRLIKLSNYDRANLIDHFGNCYRAGYVAGLKYKEKKYVETTFQIKFDKDGNPSYDNEKVTFPKDGGVHISIPIENCEIKNEKEKS